MERPLTIKDRIPKVGDVIAFSDGNATVTRVRPLQLETPSAEGANSYTSAQIEFDHDPWANSIEPIFGNTYISRADGGPVTTEAAP